MRRTRALCLLATATVGLTALTACSAASKATDKAAGAAKGAAVSVADAMSLTTRTTAQYTSMKMTETLPTLGTITSSGETSRSPFGARLTMSNPQLSKSLGSGSIQMMMNSTTMYMNLGAKGAAELGGKHWMKMDFASLGTAGKAISDEIDKSNGQDPAAAVKLLTSSGDIKKVGQETVDGVPTTHYAGTVDVKKLEAQAGLSANVKALISQAGQLGMTTETVDMWINSHNLPVRVHETSSTSQGPVDITVDYSDYGTAPVTITPPPASDTLDYAALLKQAKAAG